MSNYLKGIYETFKAILIFTGASLVYFLVMFSMFVLALLFMAFWVMPLSFIGIAKPDKIRELGKAWWAKSKL